nr:unnamed protein product [Spodoptera littoralis]
MTSTNDGKDVKSNQTSGPKGKTYYIELYKALEAGLNSDCALRERTQHLCEAWRRIHSLCQHSASTTHPHLLTWLQRHTAKTVLQTEWQSPKIKDQHKRLEDAINAFIQECGGRTSKDAVLPAWEVQLLARAEFFKQILSNPWGHPVLRVLLDPRGEPPSNEEVLAWLKEERGVMFVTRLRQLAASKCDDLALALCSAVLDRVRACAPPTSDTEADGIADLKDKSDSKKTFEDILKAEAGFTVDVLELLVDMEFVLLYKGDKRSHCIELAKQTPLRNGYQLVERLQSRLETSPREKKLWKNAKDVATLIAQSTPDMKPFVCELYVRAITAGMNELERLKLKTEKEAEARGAEQTLAGWFTQLGALLAPSARLRAECALTAFSVHPSPHLYERVSKATPPPPPARDVHETKEEPTSEFGSWASDSRSQTNFVKTSETLNLKHTKNQANVLSTAIFSEAEALGISPELCTDIAVLLSGPRLKTLSWDMDRDKLLDNCRAYMERTKFGTCALTTELKYLNLDPSQFQHLPEEEDDDTDMYYGIEKGYEHLVEQYQDPEEIWQDAEDSERTQSAVSTDIEDSPVRTKKIPRKTKKPLSSEDDSDPLSLVAEAKRIEKKKERPHSKERSKERKRTKPKAKPKDPLEVTEPEVNQSTEVKKEPKKKEKRERKKKEKAAKAPAPQAKPSSLSNLIGMKVSKITNQRPEIVRPAKIPSVSDKTNEPDVLFDGLFSMDELKSPEKSPDKNQVKKTEPQIANVTNPPPVGINQNVPTNEIAMPKVQEKPRSRTSSPSNLTSTFSPSNMSVKESLSKLLHYRRQKSFPDMEPKINLQPNVVHTYTYKKGTDTPVITPQPPKPVPLSPTPARVSPKLVQMSSTPAHVSPKPQIQDTSKIFINQTQSAQLTDLKNEVNNLLSSKTFGIARPVVPCTPKTVKLNNSLPSGSRFPSPSVQKLPPDLYRPTADTKALRPNILNKQQPEKCNTQKFHAFLKELQESINAGAGEHISKSTSSRKEIKPLSRVTPVLPAAKAEQKSSPQSAKQTQKKSDNLLNTFSRLSYIHKNKIDSKINGVNPVVEALIEYQSKTLQNPPNEAEIDRIVIEQKKAKEKYLSIKNERYDRQSYQQHDNSLSVQRKIDKPKQSISKQNPVMANMLSSTKPLKPEIHNKNNKLESPQDKPTLNALTEKDQEELVLLLRQQSKLNQQRPCVKERVPPPQTITCPTPSSFPNPSSSQSLIKNKILETPNINISNVSIKQVTKPSPSIKPSNLNNCDPKPQTKPINMVKTEYNFPKTVDPKVHKIELFSNNEVKSKHKPDTAKPGDSKETDWEKVMDAILSHKTPSRGPNALDMALNKDSYKKTISESLRNQRIVKTNSTGDNKIKMINVITKAPTNSVMNVDPKTSPPPPALSRSNSETVIKTSKSKKAPVKSLLKPVNTTTTEFTSNIKPTQPEMSKRQTQSEKRSMHSSKDQTEVYKKIPLKNNEKPFTTTYFKHDDPFISGIPNSDYDLLEELMDDDLRQEIGELSSDEESYSTPMHGLKEKSFNMSNVSIPVVREERRSNSTAINNVAVHKKTDPKVVVCEIPKTVFDPSKQLHTPGFIDPKCVTKNVDVTNPPVTVQQLPKSVNTSSKKTNKPSLNVKIDQLRAKSQTNTSTAGVPRQPTLKNMVLIGSDVVYQPCTIQNPIRTAAPTQNTYVAFNNQSNMAIYQTTQFASTVNPVIIGNATAKLTESNQTTTESEEVINNVPNKTAHDAKNDKSEPKPNSGDNVNGDIISKNDKEKVDVNSNKNISERKVLSEVQEKQKVAEKTEQKTRSQSKANCDMVNEVLKDQERLQKKRMSILNRNIIHRSDKQAIPLTYAPIIAIKIVPAVPQEINNEKNISACTKIDNTIQTIKLGTLVNLKVLNVEKPVKHDANKKCKENKDKTPRRIVLRSSSNKEISLDAITVKKVAAPKKSKARIKPVVTVNKIIEATKPKTSKKPAPKKTLNKTIKKVEVKKKATKAQPKRNTKLKLNIDNKPDLIQEAEIPNKQTVMMDLEDQIVTSKILKVISPDQPVPSLVEIPNVDEILESVESDTVVNNCTSPSILDNEDSLSLLLRPQADGTEKDITVTPEKNVDEISLAKEVADTLVTDTTKADANIKQLVTDPDVVDEIESYVKKLEDSIKDTTDKQHISLACKEIMYNTDESCTSSLSELPIEIQTETRKVEAEVNNKISVDNNVVDAQKVFDDNVDEVICIDEDDDDEPVENNGLINSDGGRIDDIPLSYLNSIIVEDISHINTGDPLKKIVRIKLPCGKVFKATVHGQTNLNIKTLFTVHALKKILLTNILSQRKRYTLNIKQLGRSYVIQSERVPNNENSLASGLPAGEVETIDLLSDSDEETQCIQTQYGKYNIKNIDKDLLEKHQKVLDKVCYVKLTKCDLSSRSSSQNDLTKDNVQTDTSTAPILDGSVYEDIIFSPMSQSTLDIIPPAFEADTSLAAIDVQPMSVPEVQSIVQTEAEPVTIPDVEVVPEPDLPPVTKPKSRPIILSNVLICPPGKHSLEKHTASKSVPKTDKQLVLNPVPVLISEPEMQSVSVVRDVQLGSGFELRLGSKSVELPVPKADDLVSKPEEQTAAMPELPQMATCDGHSFKPGLQSGSNLEEQLVSQSKVPTDPKLHDQLISNPKEPRISIPEKQSGSKLEILPVTNMQSVLRFEDQLKVPPVSKLDLQQTSNSEMPSVATADESKTQTPLASRPEMLPILTLNERSTLTAEPQSVSIPKLLVSNAEDRQGRTPDLQTTLAPDMRPVSKIDLRRASTSDFRSRRDLHRSLRPSVIIRNQNIKSRNQINIASKSVLKEPIEVIEIDDSSSDEHETITGLMPSIERREPISITRENDTSTEMNDNAKPVEEKINEFRNLLFKELGIDLADTSMPPNEPNLEEPSESSAHTNDIFFSLFDSPQVFEGGLSDSNKSSPSHLPKTRECFVKVPKCDDLLEATGNNGSILTSEEAEIKSASVQPDAIMNETDLLAENTNNAIDNFAEADMKNERHMSLVNHVIGTQDLCKQSDTELVQHEVPTESVIQLQGIQVENAAPEERGAEYSETADLKSQDIQASELYEIETITKRVETENEFKTSEKVTIENNEISALHTHMILEQLQSPSGDVCEEKDSEKEETNDSPTQESKILVSNRTDFIVQSEDTVNTTQSTESNVENIADSIDAKLKEVERNLRNIFEYTEDEIEEKVSRPTHATESIDLEDEDFTYMQIESKLQSICGGMVTKDVNTKIEERRDTLAIEESQEAREDNLIKIRSYLRNIFEGTDEQRPRTPVMDHSYGSPCPPNVTPEKTDTTGVREKNNHRILNIDTEANEITTEEKIIDESPSVGDDDEIVTVLKVIDSDSRENSLAPETDAAPKENEVLNAIKVNNERNLNEDSKEDAFNQNQVCQFVLVDDNNYFIEEIVDMHSDEILDDDMAETVIANASGRMNICSNRDQIPSSLSKPIPSLMMNYGDGNKNPNVLITQQIGAQGQIEEIDIKLNVPMVSYSKKYPNGLHFDYVFRGNKTKSLKRKAEMTDVKLYEKKYRKGKNIDYPKITITTMGDSAYSKEFKRLLDYCSSVKFSYSRPFHKEHIDVHELLKSWPIRGICKIDQPETEPDETLFSDMDQMGDKSPDPRTLTLAEEISTEYDKTDYKTCDTNETNFHMGFDPDFIDPVPFEAVVQVVQVGQLPVSASAQNPVTCDPRVTQVSNVSPSQCSAENSPGDDQSVIKTEYTELTTADLSMPLAQEYVQHIQSMPVPSHDEMNYPMASNFTVDVDIKPEIKIEMEETPEIKEETPVPVSVPVHEEYPHLKQHEHMHMHQPEHEQQYQQLQPELEQYHQMQQEHEQYQHQDQYQHQQKLIHEQYEQEQQHLQQQQHEYEQRQLELRQLQFEQEQQKLQQMQEHQLKQQQEEEQRQQQQRLLELKEQEELKQQQHLQELKLQQEELQHQQHYKS